MKKFSILISILIFPSTQAMESDDSISSLASNMEKSGLLPNFNENWRHHMHLWHHFHRTATDSNSDSSSASHEHAHGHANHTERSIMRDESQAEFKCDTTRENNATTPWSVHRLQANDISIIGAMGASFVAGNGADAQRLMEISMQYRGVAFPIGGDADLNSVITLPNIIRRYNPYLEGFSKSIAPAWFEDLSQLNVAIPGASAGDLDDQAKELVKRIKKIRGHETKWKLITIFVGLNDLCDNCGKRIGGRASTYGRHIKSAIDRLHKDLTRTFVNLVALPPLYQFYRQLHDDLVCLSLHRYLCPCILDPNSDRLAAEYNTELYDLARKYDRLDFAVVVQPFFSGKTQIPKANVNDSQLADQSFFAPDCFHFSRKGHAAAAQALWENLFQRVGSKENNFNFTMHQLGCPDENCPYIRTVDNSRQCQHKGEPIVTFPPEIANHTGHLFPNHSDIFANVTPVTPYTDFSRHWNHSRGHNTTRQVAYTTVVIVNSTTEGYRRHHHWNWTGTWNYSDLFENFTAYFTLKPWYPPPNERKARPIAGGFAQNQDVSVGDGSGYYSYTSSGWIAFGIVLGAAVLATLVIGTVSLYRRRRPEHEERTPLLRGAQSVEQIY